MALLHEVEAETLQITRFRNVACRKSYEFAGLRTAPATHRARNTANTCKYHVFMQNAAKRRFWDHTMGGRGCFSFGGTVQYIEESNIYLCFVVCRLKRGLVT